MTKIFNAREFAIKIALDSYPYKTLFNEEEFKRDFLRFYISRKMARRFVLTNSINDRLLLNNIIICLNIFGIKACNMIWKVICCDDEFSVIKSCLMFLNSLIPNDSTPYHKKVLEILNTIKQKYIISPNE